MGHIYIPAKSPGDWARLLADPVKHWRTGYSARTLACSWQNADGFLAGPGSPNPNPKPQLFIL